MYEYGSDLDFVREMLKSIQQQHIKAKVQEGFGPYLPPSDVNNRSS